MKTRGVGVVIHKEIYKSWASMHSYTTLHPYMAGCPAIGIRNELKWKPSVFHSHAWYHWCKLDFLVYHFSGKFYLYWSHTVRFQILTMEFHSSPLRVGYGASFLGLNLWLMFYFNYCLLHPISYHIGPRYGGAWLYLSAKSYSLIHFVLPQYLQSWHQALSSTNIKIPNSKLWHRCTK